MRVAVVGASGNTGTALLHALRGEERVSEVVGIARRRPDADAEPYDVARWEQVDIAAPVALADGEDFVVEELAQALDGVDTVVHLAWLIQPNHERDLLRRANVDGTRRVVEACLRAGVGHLVVASSVGSYSPVDDDERRDESWPAHGSASTSHYAVDKAAQERILDDAEAAGLSVARVRPALVFDADAGAEIMRLFLGALVPPALLRPGALPFLPLPAGLRLQVVHGDDLADAYRRIIVQGATGAFNVATEPVLTGTDLAEVLDHGRVVEVPPAALRPVVSLAWQTRALAADAGWLDMAMNVPLMDTTRARTELGWEPSREARETLRELLVGMVEGQGTPSPQMRPRESWPQDQLPPGSVPTDGLVAEAEEDSAAHRVPAHLQRDILGLYLSDHLTGATAGLERSERMAADYADTELGEDLARVALEIREERELLVNLMDSLALRRRPHRQAAAWAAERVGRLKVNERLSGSPMTPVLESELMRSAVMGKLGLWQTLTELSPDLGLPAPMFEALAQQARDQAETYERFHQHIVGDVFRDGEVD
ncbi:Nucleoside-diphosphate-sugar epimerase [Georgenia satyanarayanai]|uniref:Nucleoside-diphosphate-sugar epimerase n=1 Tax=Georgenia satyanarayanai TaxID=860221 RepID=A0A2Y9BWZ8_9MICO|nr:NAD-dependent epimerase/dehydratase family protein [Georgenia satyanarayanai]PYG00563.1 nucleoside-diphosphate-sugar epimerase [Georgenia satyanarayanai]SSA39952.1 Nucleoside-diphosphate-sugar epimerase [Georgenia satyanarayanai]